VENTLNAFMVPATAGQVCALLIFGLVTAIRAVAGLQDSFRSRGVSGASAASEEDADLYDVPSGNVNGTSDLVAGGAVVFKNQRAGVGAAFGLLASGTPRCAPKIPTSLRSGSLAPLFSQRT
jgi:hypothetical protein